MLVSMKIRLGQLSCLLAVVLCGVRARYCQSSASSGASVVEHNERVCFDPHCVTAAAGKMKYHNRLSIKMAQADFEVTVNSNDKP